MRRLGFALLVSAGLLASAPAFAHDGHAHGPGPVVVVEVEGPMDHRLIDYVASTIDATDAQLIVLRIDSPGLASGDVSELLTSVGGPVPVAVWVGPQNAVAYGRAAHLLGPAIFTGAAPGAHIGFTYVGDDDAGGGSIPGGGAALDSLGATRAEVGAPDSPPGLVDVITPTIGQFIASLDGLEFDGVALETADQTTLADGSVVTIPSVEVRFVKPGLFTRFLRLSIRPESAFFFLVTGLALVAFEFYAAGVGVTAAVAALSLFLATYGIATLPVRWWAVALAVFGIGAYTWDFQRNRLGWRSLVGTAALLLGGLQLTDAAPRFEPRWWAVLVVVAGLALFYGFAMTTVVRSRFSTPTIGREHLIGRAGVARSDLDPDGIVSVGGATWRATAHRAAGIKDGDAVSVLGVSEIVLEVAPVEPPPPT